MTTIRIEYNDQQVRTALNKLLRAGADLKRSITQDRGSSSVEVGTITRYATTHQFGAKKGQFGTTKRGAPIPWGDIPARPFLGVATEQEDQIQQAVLDFIASRGVKQ